MSGDDVDARRVVKAIATDQRSVAADRLIQLGLAAAAATISGMIVANFGDWKQAIDAVPLLAGRLERIDRQVETMPQRIDAATADRFTATDGQRLEGRLNGRIEGLHEALQDDIEQNRQDIRDLRRDIRSSLPPHQREAFDRARMTFTPSEAE